MSQSIYLYFIEAEELGLIKIGISAMPDYRLKQLDTGSPVDLNLRGTIEIETFDVARSIERKLHERLKFHKAKGEWFKVEYDIVKAIAQTVIEERTKKKENPALSERVKKRSEEEAALFEQGKSDYHAGKKFNDFPRVGAEGGGPYYRTKDAWQEGWREARNYGKPQTERVTLLSVSK